VHKIPAGNRHNHRGLSNGEDGGRVKWLTENCQMKKEVKDGRRWRKNQMAKREQRRPTGQNKVSIFTKTHLVEQIL